jgi:hypothetical protein
MQQETDILNGIDDCHQLRTAFEVLPPTIIFLFFNITTINHLQEVREFILSSHLPTC